MRTPSYFFIYKDEIQRLHEEELRLAWPECSQCLTDRLIYTGILWSIVQFGNIFYDTLLISQRKINCFIFVYIFCFHSFPHYAYFTIVEPERNYAILLTSIDNYRMYMHYYTTTDTITHILMMSQKWPLKLIDSYTKINIKLK